jgi:hypothetical protein
MKHITMRKQITFIISMMTVLVFMLSGLALADKYTDTIEVYKKSEAVQPFFKSAYGYVVFPTIGKGGLGIGGAYGKGSGLPGWQSYRAKHPLSNCPSVGRPAGRPSVR